MRLSFQLALAFSLLLHGAVLLAPGWELSPAEAATALRPLDATLAPLAQVAAPGVPQAVPVKRPAPRPLADPQQPATARKQHETVAVPVAESVAVAPELPPSSIPGGEPREAAEPDAVPPEPTFTTAFADVWPQRGRIRFEVTRGDGGFIVGQAEHRWQHDGATYQLRAVTETVGIAALFKPAAVVQESRGAFVATGLQPLEFKADLNRKPRLTLRLDPDLQRLFSGDGGDGGDGQAMTGQTQDMLSLLYQLGALPPGKTEFVVMVATGRKIERHTVLLLETLTLDTAFGARTVQHLKLPGKPGAGVGHDESTEVWLDIVTRLPLKIRHRDRKGEVFDQTAMAVELGNPK